MHPDIHLVIELQSLDQRIAALDKEIAALPKHIAAIEKTLETHVRRLEADKAALSANQKDRKKLEGDIQAHEQKISKLKDQMLTVKNNEQYRAFLNEIDYIQKEIRKAEDRILELMAESELLEGNVKKADAGAHCRRPDPARTAPGAAFPGSRKAAGPHSPHLRPRAEEVVRLGGGRGGKRPLLRLPNRDSPPIPPGP